jgi:predicted amidohydrolase YtcJ
MAKKAFLWLLIIACLAAFADCQKAEKVEPADLVVKNARVFTVDKDSPWAEAIAFKGEWVVAVGAIKDIEKYVKDGTTEVIDAGGKLVVPGFNDAHTHFGPIDTDDIDLRYITDPNIITERVKEAVAKAQPGQLISGGHWEHEMFTTRQWPTKELIDSVSPKNPVILTRADGHSSLVNSYVLKKSGITKNTPDPEGGEIQKDPKTGEPTGIFKETARRLLKTGAVPVQRTPEDEEARRVAGYQAALDMAARLGVTTVQIMGSSSLRGGTTGAEMWERFRNEGKLTCRIYFSGIMTDNEESLKKFDEIRKKYPLSENWIRFAMLKGFIDGTLGSGTMLVFEPFLDAPDKTGLPQMSYEELERAVVASDKWGFQIGIHAIGDKANSWILNAYEKAQQVNGKRDSRHRSEHAQILRLDDIPRFAQLGVIASMQPTHCITDKRFAEKRIGRERCKGAYAWRRLLDAGAKIAFGTDYSVEPLDPVEGLYAAVTRKDRAGEPGEGWFPDQKLTLEEAIKLYTLDSAYAEFMEDRKGMLKKGYLADAVIFDQDLFKMAPDDLMKAKVDTTIVGGKVAYKKASR